MEGLEHFAESFFGPGGYFPQKNIAKMLREKRALSYNKIQDMDEKVSKRLLLSIKGYFDKCKLH